MKESDDDELLKRFKALKAPRDDEVDSPLSTLRQASEAARDEDDEMERIADGRYVPPRRSTKSSRDEDKELRARVASLSGREAPEEDAELSDHEIEAFMASLTSPNAPQNNENGAGLLTPPEDLAALNREASALLKSTSHFVQRDPPSESHDPPQEKSHEDDEETEEQILTRALEEASLDRLPSPSASPPPGDSPETSTPAESSFSFPTLPTHNPESAGEDPEVAARMNLLFGLSGPTSKPAAKGTLGPPPSARQAGQGWNIAGYEDSRDDDLDSWCCICNQDATLQCLGCDGDVYCGKCWAEGHGPGGEQGHTVKKFTWKKK